MIKGFSEHLFINPNDCDNSKIKKSCYRVLLLLIPMVVLSLTLFYFYKIPTRDIRISILANSDIKIKTLDMYLSWDYGGIPQEKKLLNFSGSSKNSVDSMHFMIEYYIDSYYRDSLLYLPKSFSTYDFFGFRNKKTALPIYKNLFNKLKINWPYYYEGVDKTPASLLHGIAISHPPALIRLSKTGVFYFNSPPTIAVVQSKPNQDSTTKLYYDNVNILSPLWGAEKGNPSVYYFGTTSGMNSPHFYDIYDISKTNFHISLEFPTFLLDSCNTSLKIEFGANTEFSKMIPEPDIISMSSITFNDVKKIKVIEEKGIWFQTKHTYQENIQSIRLFVITSILGFSFAKAIRQIINIIKILIFRKHSNN